MSLNQLYKKIPVEQRICEGCGEPIIRNIANFDGHLYHFGCFKRSKAKPTHLCMDCFAYLSGKGISKVTVDGYTMKHCKQCGSSNLKFLRRWKREAATV